MLCCHLTAMWLAVQVNAFARASHSTRYIPRVREASAAQQWQPARLFRCQTTIFAAEIYFLVVIVLHGNTTHWLHSAHNWQNAISHWNDATRGKHYAFFITQSFSMQSIYIVCLCIGFVPFANPTRKRREKKLNSHHRGGNYLLCVYRK